MKMYAWFFGLLFCFSTFAQDEILLKGDFRPLTPGIRVEGSTVIIRTLEGRDFVSIHDFKLKGGVVLDLKVCGEMLDGQNACISIGEPRLRKQSWEISFPFKAYHKVVIFDLDLIQNLAVVK